MQKKGPYRKAAARPNPPIVKTFLREWRHHRGMTISDLSAATGLGTGTISGIENGRQGYSAASLAGLADALDVSLGMLLTIDPNGAEDLWPLLSEATPQQRELVTAYARGLIRPTKGRS